jgi:hypothetical protein
MNSPLTSPHFRVCVKMTAGTWVSDVDMTRTCHWCCITVLYDPQASCTEDLTLERIICMVCFDKFCEIENGRQ